MCRRIIKIKRSTLGTSIVFRSPISRKWLFNITIAPKRESLEINTNIPTVLGKVGYAFTLGAIALLFLGACSPTESESRKGPVTVAHPTACIYMDSLNVEYIKGLEKYALKVSSLSRARCHGEDGYITCSARSADTLYTVETACPVKAVR